MTPACAGDHAKSEQGYLTGDVRRKFIAPHIAILNSAPPTPQWQNGGEKSFPSFHSPLLPSAAKSENIPTG